MHVYLAIYLTFHWTNWSIWGFTVFEALGFIYLLVVGEHRRHTQKKEQKSVSSRHLLHYQFCGCLGDKAVCCDPSCDCEE